MDNHSYIDVMDNNNCIKPEVEDINEALKREIDGIRFSEKELAAIADSIYARRCEEHVMVLKDCPKNIKGGFGAFLYKIKNKGRYIPPYCCQWCDMLIEPTATLKDGAKFMNGKWLNE